MINNKAYRLNTRALIISIVSLGFLTNLVWASATDFTTYSRYNLSGQVTGVIQPDPDGDGELTYPAMRNTYNSQGLLSKVENGVLATWQSESVAPSAWTGFSVNSTVEYSYTARGLKQTEFTTDGASTYTLTQYSYDKFDRLQCKAVRMNPGAFSSLPASACTLGAAGDEGHDRITQYTYNDAGQVLTEKRAVGTSLEQTYVEYQYDNYPGLKSDVIDANGNRAELEYDSLARLEYWYFPSKTQTGSASTTDYEKYTYDSNGNRTALRKRDGSVISYQYDDLNRLHKKDIPGSTTEDVYYTYDLRGLQTEALFASTTGKGIKNTYDGFGRIEKSTNTLGNNTRDILYLHDDNGNRERLTFPGGLSMEVGYDDLDRLTSVSKHGGSTLLSQSYNQQQMPDTVSRLTDKTSTTYGYDGIARLKSFQHDLKFRSADNTTTYGYNAASQLTSSDISNDRYHYIGNHNLTGSYEVNGLNQYTSVNGVTITHDDNGNLTSYGNTTYTYDVENRLTSVIGDYNATLTYDPMGRLFKVVSGSSTTEFLYDGDALVAEYDGNNNMLRRYVHGAGVDQPLIWYEGSGMADADARLLHANHQGSIVAITDADGKELQINTYDAYGIPAEDILGRFAYTGQMYLPEVGLYHYKARIYHPKLGRFLQTDPVGYEDQLNLYAYVGNDPVNYTDPSGKWLNFVVAAVVGCAKSSGCRSAVRKGINKVATVVGATVAAKEGNDLIQATKAGIEKSQKSSQALEELLNGTGSVEDAMQADLESKAGTFNAAAETGDFLNAVTPKGDSLAADIHTIATAPDSLMTEQHESSTAQSRDKQTSVLSCQQATKANCE